MDVDVLRAEAARHALRGDFWAAQCVVLIDELRTVRSATTAAQQGGRRQKAEAGGFAYGSPAYGFEAKGGELVPEPGEQATVDRIRELSQTDMSLRQLCKVLDAEGHTTKRGKAWNPESLRRVIARL